ncbi:MAG: DUF192 domain-containing protein [Treponema sp.]|nr:DUF192 domain-containing protein [Treponema sp.]
MKNAKFFMVVAFITTVFFTSCKENTKTASLQIICQNGKTTNIKVELAITPEEQQTGFMFRKNIPAGTGMLFIFDHDQYLHFYMKNTPTPLSIAYIDSEGFIKDIFDMSPFSLETISSSTKARYALEVPQGWFNEQSINIGDKLKITDELIRKK